MQHRDSEDWGTEKFSVTTRTSEISAPPNAAAKGAQRSRTEQVPEQVPEWYPSQTLSPLIDGGVNSVEWDENRLDVLIKLKETD